MGASNYLENLILDTLRNQSLAISNCYLSLHTADPTDSAAVASGNEASGASYARQLITFSAAASGQIKNSSTITFSNMPGGTYTHFAIWNHQTNKSESNYLWHGSLVSSKTIDTGDQLSIAANQLILSCD